MTTVSDKNEVSGTEHHRPRGWERFFERPCAMDCVPHSCHDDAYRSGTPRSKVLKVANGIV